jgi:SAM-dependent methyltransferase
MRQKLENIRRLVDELLAEMVETELLGENSSEQEFETLQGLLQSEAWPEAVPPGHIADESSEADKQERAEGIAALILPPTTNRRFLDLGCGEGHVVGYASGGARVSVGYDIRRPERSPFQWEEDDGKMLLTTDFEKVRSRGPYDVILIYDVIDHAEEETMDEILERAASVLHPDGSIYLRCHPWCGRHGGHAYRSFNKAFVHLVFSSEEMEHLGVACPPHARVLFPIDTYSEAISMAGLYKAEEPEIETHEVESFFEETPLVRRRILKSFGIHAWGDSPPRFQMSQCFLDFVLKKS